MRHLSSARDLTDKYKEELKSWIKNKAEENDNEAAYIAVLAAMGEVTAEFGIATIGRERTSMLLSEIAASVQINIANDLGIRPANDLGIRPD